MRYKMVQSEVDGLFMKTNRKHQILLNFELKRIAVEQKMRERYFAFEKSLLVAHQSKIITRQKALGIYSPKTTSPNKKQTANSHFFISNVSMGTKARVKLPPLREEKGKEKSSCNKDRISSASRSGSARNAAVSMKRDSLPSVNQGWSLTEIGDKEESLVDKCIEDSAKNDIDSLHFGSEKDSVGIVTGDLMSQNDGHNMASSLIVHNESSPEQKSGHIRSEKRRNSGKDKNGYEQAQKDSCKTGEAAGKILNSQQVTEDSGAQSDTNQTHKLQGKAEESIHNEETYNKQPSLSDADERPKSASSLENSIEGVKAELLNLNLRAQSAVVKAK